MYLHETVIGALVALYGQGGICLGEDTCLQQITKQIVWPLLNGIPAYKVGLSSGPNRFQ